jgi:homoserine kinase
MFNSVSGDRLPQQVTVRVPASTANLGPGFDCLGMALDIWDEITVAATSDVGQAPPPVAPDHVGQAPSPVRGGEDSQVQDLVLLAAQRFCKAAGLAAGNWGVKSRRTIPIGRGLGSSAAAIVAGCLAANALCGKPLDIEAVGQIAADVEGHPDNSTPCLFGGFRVCVLDRTRVVHQSVRVPDGLGCVLFVPDFPLPTHETRKLLPEALSRTDVVFQTSRAALFVAAMANGALEHLGLGTQDRLHQPARGQVFTGMQTLFGAAMGAGALCAYLSGGGPTIAAFVRLGTEGPVRRALDDAAKTHSIGGVTLLTKPSQTGAHLLE